MARSFLAKALAILAVVALVITSVLPAFAAGATLGVSAPRAATVGGTFVVTVTLSTQQAANAVEVTLAYPTDLVEPVSATSSGSIVQLWVRDPVISASNGRINGTGAIVTPGYTGNGGKVMAATFRAKKLGSARFSIAAARVLANDGAGTDITGGLGAATVEVREGVAAPEQTTAPATPGTPPPVPSPASPTHAEPESWYGASSATFTWPMTDEIIGVRAYVDRSDKPGVQTPSSTLAVGSFAAPDLADGQWYFHLSLQNAAGWGPEAVRGFRVDHTGPERLDVERLADDRSWWSAAFAVVAGDKGSGLARFRFQVDGGAWVEREADDSGFVTFRSSTLRPGEHTLRVVAIDRAGNAVTQTLPFAVAFASRALWTLLASLVLLVVALTYMTKYYRLRAKVTAADQKIAHKTSHRR